MTVTVTDAVGNVQTVVVPFRLRIFPC
jgi:hypothetical protein